MNAAAPGIVRAVAVAAVAAVVVALAAPARGALQPAQWIAVRYIPDQNAVGLAWSAVPRALRYTLLKREVGGGELQRVETVTRLQFLDRAVEQGKRYRYVVRPEDAAGPGPASAEAEVLVLDPRKLPPPAPTWTDFEADPGSGVSLLWAAAPGASSYKVYRREGEAGEFALLGSSTVTRFVDRGVKAGARYEYRLSAVNAVGVEGAFSETRAAQLPAIVEKEGGRAPAFEIRVRATRSVKPFVPGGQIPFKAPVDIALGPAGQVYVLDNQAPGVFVFSAEGELLRMFGRAEAGVEPVLRSPYGIGVDEDGAVWVTDRKKDSEIIRFDAATGRVLGVVTFAVPPRREALERLAGRRRTESPFAYDVAFLPGGDLVVTDNTFDRVCLLDRKGKLLAEFGLPGDGPGEFDRPSKIDVDPEGRIIVLDAQNRRVQAFSREGTPQYAIGRASTMVGGFLGLSGIAFDAEGSVFIADSPMATVQAFSRQDGSYRYHVGGEDGRADAGGNRSQWDVTTPSGLAFDSRTRRLWIGMPMIANIAIREFVP